MHQLPTRGMMIYSQLRLPPEEKKTRDFSFNYRTYGSSKRLSAWLIEADFSFVMEFRISGSKLYDTSGRCPAIENTTVNVPRLPASIVNGRDPKVLWGDPNFFLASYSTFFPLIIIIIIISLECTDDSYQFLSVISTYQINQKILLLTKNNIYIIIIKFNTYTGREAMFNIYFLFTPYEKFKLVRFRIISIDIIIFFLII